MQSSAADRQKSLCAHCPRRQECAKPCEKLEKLLNSPDLGRLSCNISANKIADSEILFARAHLLDARSEAVVYLYYRCGLAMERIAEAFKLNRSSVSRILQKCWIKVGGKRNKTASSREAAQSDEKRNLPPEASDPSDA